MNSKTFITISIFLLALIYIPVDASYRIANNHSEKNEHMSVSLSRDNNSQPQPLQPSTPQQGDPLLNHKEKQSTHHSGKGHHAEEDGKHHHFHMDRMKRFRRFCNLFTLFTKCFLAVAHICILIGLFKALISH